MSNYELNISAMSGFEFKSKDVSFNIHCVTKDIYEIFIGGAYIRFPSKFAHLKIDDLSSNQAVFMLLSRGDDEHISLSLNLPLEAAIKLNATFPSLKLVSQS